MTRAAITDHRLTTVSPVSHIELERTADIQGTPEQRKEYIRKIWDFVKGSAHYKAAYHAPRSSAELVQGTTLGVSHRELRLLNGPDRHKLILDTPSLDLWRAGIQARIEVSQRLDRAGQLVRIFRGTVKVGDKADVRIEEEAALDPECFAEKGFFRAFKDAMKSEDRGGQYQALKLSMAQVLGISEFHARDYLVYPVLYLRADTKKTLYSPEDDSHTVLELKTDDVHWETIARDTGHITQVEIELKYADGDAQRVERELASLCAQFDFLKPSDLSKPSIAMGALARYLVPANDSASERARAVFNAGALAPHLSRTHFQSVDPKSLNLRLPEGPGQNPA